MSADDERMVSEWQYGVFRDDTGEQVGIGTTPRLVAAQDDAHAWGRDGIAVTLRRRPVGPWVPCKRPVVHGQEEA